MYAQDNNSLPVWNILSQAHHHISINSQPLLVGIVSIFSDTPAVDDGSTMAHFFCGRDTLVCDAYGIKSTKQFINTLSDNIRKRGAMETLISDGANMKSPSASLISSVPCSSKIISLNLIINIKIRLKIALDLPSVTPTLP